MFEPPVLDDIPAGEYDEIAHLLMKALDHPLKIGSIKRFFRIFGNWTYKIIFDEPQAVPVVLRRYQPYRSQERFLAETHALRLLRHVTEVPAPRILRMPSALIPTEERYVLMEYIPGYRLQENIYLLSEPQRRQIADHLGRYLARIHSIRCRGYGEPVAGAESPDSELSYTQVVFSHLISEAARTAILASDEIERLNNDFQQKAALLDETVPSLIHGDMIDANILIQPGGEGVSGILDFEHSQAWSPEIDFTKLLLRFRDYPDMVNHLMEAYFRHSNRNDPASIARFYARLELFQTIMDLQLVVNLAKSDPGFFVKLLTGSRHLPYLQYQRLMAAIHRPVNSTGSPKTAVHIKFLRQAKVIAQQSRCQGVDPAGAILVRGNEILGSGYNECLSLPENWTEETAGEHYVRAELVALLIALRNEQHVQGSTIYITGYPSPASILALKKAGITELVFVGETLPPSSLAGIIDSMGLVWQVFTEARLQKATSTNE